MTPGPIGWVPQFDAESSLTRRDWGVVAVLVVQQRRVVYGPLVQPSVTGVSWRWPGHVSGRYGLAPLSIANLIGIDATPTFASHAPDAEARGTSFLSSRTGSRGHRVAGRPDHARRACPRVRPAHCHSCGPSDAGLRHTLWLMRSLPAASRCRSRMPIRGCFLLLDHQGGLPGTLRRDAAGRMRPWLRDRPITMWRSTPTTWTASVLPEVTRLRTFLTGSAASGWARRRARSSNAIGSTGHLVYLATRPCIEITGSSAG